MLKAVQRLVILVLICVAAAAVAQQTDAPPQGNVEGPPAQVRQGAETPAVATGSVTGTVIAQDTSRPVRFAEVLLVSAAPASGQGAGRGGGGFFGGAQARTEVDGSFEMTDVAPGDYYVTAGAPGYISERELLQIAVAAGADPADLLARVPMVHVMADSTSSINLTIQRGGVLAGRVFWEDGSPATGVMVDALPNPPPAALPASLQAIRSPNVVGVTSASMTDDRGSFRIPGLVAGDYLLVAQLQTRGGFGGFGRGQQLVSTIRVYAPGTFRKASAKPITVRNAEERDDVRLVIDLRGLHTVSGVAISASSTQTVASGRVTLADPTDTSLQLMGSIEPDGSFHVRYVPPGSYTLQIGGASTQVNSGFGRGRGGGGGSGSGGTTFQPFTMPVTVTDSDLTGVAAPLTALQ